LYPFLPAERTATHVIVTATRAKAKIQAGIASLI
jgi:hypothetical protein